MSAALFNADNIYISTELGHERTTAPNLDRFAMHPAEDGDKFPSRARRCVLPRLHTLPCVPLISRR
jgi:hypothetical protein